jgi:hypothetical protein
MTPLQQRSLESSDTQVTITFLDAVELLDHLHWNPEPGDSRGGRPHIWFIAT